MDEDNHEVIYSASGPLSYVASMDEVIYIAPWSPWQKSAIALLNVTIGEYG
jgi:hypothetical protein